MDGEYGTVDKFVTSELVDMPTGDRIHFVLALCDQWGMSIRDQEVVRLAVYDSNIDIGEEE